MADKKGYNEPGKVTVEKSADGYRTDIRVGAGTNHSHTIIENDQVIFDRGVDDNGKSVTFVDNSPGGSQLTGERGATLPDATK